MSCSRVTVEPPRHAPKDGDHCQRHHRVAGLPQVCVLIGLGETRKRERSAIAARTDGPSPPCTTWRPPGPRRPSGPGQLEVLATARNQRQICGTWRSTWVRVWVPAVNAATAGRPALAGGRPLSKHSAERNIGNDHELARAYGPS